jgi:uncharacterized membrane protein YeaQ/YmgE (transglycosylase-associated protein family)
MRRQSLLLRARHGIVPFVVGPVAGRAAVPQNSIRRHNSARKEPLVMLGTNSLIVVLVVGLVAGWLAAKIVQGTGLGIIGDIIVGVIGAFIGRWLFNYFHVRIGVNFWVDAILTATIGAVVLLVAIRLIRRL